MNNGKVANVTAIIHAPIDRVWKALVDPQDIPKYMMGAQVITDWTEGGSIRWKGEMKGKPYEDSGRVLKVREPDMLSYTHKSGATDSSEEHVIIIELKEVGGVTHLRLTQDNNATDEAREQSEANWAQMLDGLKKILGEAPVSSEVERK